MSSVARRLASFGTSSIVARLVPIALLPIMARALSADDVGLVALALAIAQVLVIAFTLGINISVTRTYYDEPDRDSRTNWAGLLLVQAAVATGGAVILYFLTGVSAVYEVLGGFATAVPAAILIGWAMSLQQSITGVARAAQRADEILVSTVLQTVTTLSIALVGLYFRSPTAFLVALASGPFVAAAFLWVRMRPSPRFSANRLRGALILGFPFILHSLALWGLSLSDRLLVEWALGAEDVGRYYLIYSYATAVLLLFDAANSVITPRLISGTFDEAKDIAKGLLLSWTWMAVFLCLLINALAHPGLVILNVDPSMENKKIVAVISLVAVTRPLYLLAIALRLHNRKSGAVAFASVIAVTVNVAINIQWLQSGGLIVAAWATLASYIVQLLILQLGAPQGGSLKAARVLLPAGVCVASVILLVQLYWIGLFVAFVIVVVVGAVAVRSGEWNRLRRMVRR